MGHGSILFSGRAFSGRARPWRRTGVALVVTGALAGTSACGPAASQAASPSPRVVRVVAAENFWGALAAQLGGAHAAVASLITDPNVDPHEFEATTAAARAVAGADYVVVNGAGYDGWAQNLLSASPAPGRRILDVAELLHKRAGDNPHFWYNPDYVERVIEQMDADYQAIDPRDAAYFRARLAATRSSLAPYEARIEAIRDRYAGTKVAATEDIFSYLARALGLDLVSPTSFMQAVAEGNDPPASSVATFQHQLSDREVRILVYNVQTSTKVTTDARAVARAAGIPVVGVSETVQPPGASFESWQDRQLDSIGRALGGAR